MYRALTLPLLVTIFFHGIILAAILIDAPKEEPKVRRAATEYIRAELVTIEKLQPKKKPAKPRKKTPKKPSKKSVDESKAKRLAEEKAAREKANQKQAQETKSKQEKERKEAQEKKRQREKQQRIQEQNERELSDSIDQESALKQVTSAAELANSYIALITESIQNSWSRPPSARNNMEAELALQLMPTGEVVSVNVVKSSGNPAFDRSAEVAVLRAGRFPELQQLPIKVFEDYFRRLHLKFRPEDLRQ